MSIWRDFQRRFKKAVAMRLDALLCKFCEMPNALCECFNCKQCGQPDIRITPAKETTCRCVEVIGDE